MGRAAAAAITASCIGQLFPHTYRVAAAMRSAASAASWFTHADRGVQGYPNARNGVDLLILFPIECYNSHHVLDLDRVGLCIPVMSRGGPAYVYRRGGSTPIFSGFF